MTTYVLGATVAHVVEFETHVPWRADGQRVPVYAWEPLCTHIAPVKPGEDRLQHASVEDQPVLPWCKRCRAVLRYRVEPVFPELTRSDHG